MRSVKMHEAKTHFSKLIADVERGEEIVVQRGDKPVARIVPHTGDTGTRTFGSLKGKIWMSDDFDDPLPEFDEYR